MYEYDLFFKSTFWMILGIAYSAYALWMTSTVKLTIFWKSRL